MERKFVEMSFSRSAGVLFSLEWLWEVKEAPISLISLAFYFLFFAVVLENNFL